MHILSLETYIVLHIMNFQFLYDGHVELVCESFYVNTCRLLAPLLFLKCLYIYWFYTHGSSR